MSSPSARETGIEYPAGLVSVIATADIPDPARKLATGELVEWIRETPAGSFALDRRFLPGISDQAHTAQFIEIEEHSKTREESARHQVRFGQLLLHSPDDAEQSLYVAVKPFNTPRQAAHEYAVASYFSNGSIPGITTFRPLGVFNYAFGDGKNKYGVMSNYRHSVRSLDTVLWNPNAVNDAAMVSKALGRAALTLGTLHINEWTHGDAQVKNIAWDILQPVQTTFLIDVEEARPFPRWGGRIEPMAAAQNVREDIKWFLRTALYLKKNSSPDYEDLVKNNFCIGYTGMTAIHGRDVLKMPGIYPAYDELVSIFEEQRDELKKRRSATA